MAEKQNPWKTEAARHTKQFADVREMKFKDNKSHKIRILPNKNENELPYFGYTIHWVPQKTSQYGKPVVHDFEKRCVICEHLSELWNELHRLKEEEGLNDKSPEVMALQSQISAIRGQKKYDFNIIDRGEPRFENDNGEMVVMPKRMSVSKSVWEPIMDYAKKDEWGNPSDEEKGYDFEITTEGEQKRRIYGVIANRSSKALTAEEIEAIKLGYDLRKKPTTMAELKEVLAGAKAPFDIMLKKLNGVVEDETDGGDSDDGIVEEEETRTSTPKTTPKREAVEPEVERETEVVAESNDAEDINNINNYQCKGEHEPTDTGCKECPVMESCAEFKPIMQKAKELGVDVGETQTVETIKKEVAAKSASSAPKGFKPKRPLPF